MSPNKGATDESGFRALPAGCWGGSFFYLGSSAVFWSDTEKDSINAFSWGISNEESVVVRYPLSKMCGLSIRLVKDD